MLKAELRNGLGLREEEGLRVFGIRCLRILKDAHIRIVDLVSSNLRKQLASYSVSVLCRMIVVPVLLLARAVEYALHDFLNVYSWLFLADPHVGDAALRSRVIFGGELLASCLC